MVSGISLAAESNPLPVGIPPVMGKAVAEATEGDESKSGWTIALTLPRGTWREIQVAMPKLDWPEPNWEEVRPGFRDGTIVLPMGGNVKPAFCRVVDTSGQELDGDQVLTQLKSQAPVLVSASGRIPHACYLRLSTPAKLIVLLGPSDKQGVANPRVPADKAHGERIVDLKDWTEEESQEYFFGLMQKSQNFKVKTKEEASKYLQGIWRLDKRAHIGGGHYVRADRGDDVTVICTDEWLVVRLMNGKQASDATVARFDRIELDDSGHLRVKGKNSISFDHFQPLDEDHMAVLNYDFIAVVRRIACRTPKPAEDEAQRPSVSVEGTSVEKSDDEAIEAAKAHLRALMTSNKELLNKSYAAKVRLMRRDEVLDREKVVEAALKQFAGGPPEAAIDLFLRRLKFESLKVAEGEFVTSPSPTIRSEDGRLRFAIEKGDAVIKIAQGPSAWFLHLRKVDSKWTVKAEYTD
jgi:hypothetical protein